MSEQATIHVSDISPGTSNKEIEDFFSFCGKIASISVTPASGEENARKSASVTFEKDTAAKTALLLDNTQLGATVVHVEAAQKLGDIAPAANPAEAAKEEEDDHIPQEDKPRSRIFAEYLAHGYALGDPALQKAIALDQKHGFSARFTTALSNFDKKVQATDRARGLDESYQLSAKAASGWRGINSYFEKALDTPNGRKLRDFYLQTDKQVRDIHNEARRLADLKNGKIPQDSEAPSSGQTAPATGDTAAAAANVAPSAAPPAEPTAAVPPTEPKA